MGGGEALNYSPVPVVVSEGEWAGWTYPASDPFEHLAGPFYSRREADGRMRCGFRAEPRHMNGGGFIHGGCLMAFADFALFIIADDLLQERYAVTAAFNAEFLGPARIGDLIEATGEVVKAGASMIFVRGIITAAGQPAMSMSGVLKKTGARS